jgi:cytochrome c-type biogenesis protein CcsB
MKKVFSFITSIPFMAFLLLVFAFSMAIATFVESSYGTPTAQSLIYKTHWFELILVLLAINLLNNLLKYKFFTKKRITLGLFHISFLVILLGAAITRYISYEGMMHIRENQSSNNIISTESYFYAQFENQEKEKKVLFSESAPKQFSAAFEVNGNPVKIKAVGYIENAEKKPIPSENGEPIIDFVYSSPTAQGMQTFMFHKGDFLDYPGFPVGFEAGETTGVSFFMIENQLFVTSIDSLHETTMATQETVTFAPGDTIQAKNMFLYSFRGFRFLIRNFLPNATFTAVKSQGETREDAVMIQISDGIKEQTVPVFGHSGVAPDTISVPLGDGQLKLAYGSMPIPVPFSIYLKDFQLERYPGSQSPSSFASEVVLQDDNIGLKKDIRIFMNNTLNYNGYKFFQSSYDTDEQGTILSVNHDLWGTWITYLGYALLILGIVLSMLNKNSYFQFLTRKLKQSSIKLVLILLTVGGLSMGSAAQTGVGAGIPDINDETAELFSKLWVQGVDGRIEPLSTLNSEIVRKVSGKSSLYGKSADEVVLSMMTYPEIWRTMQIIKVSNKILAEQLGASGKFVTIEQLIDGQGNYKIADNVQEAYKKAPAFRNQLEKEYINVDERVNICFMVFDRSMFNLYPRKTREAGWYAPGANATDYSGGDSIFIHSGFQLLLQTIAEQKYTDAGQILMAVENFQNKYGGELIPSQSKRNIEILYNKVNPFKRVFPFYLLCGLLLLFVLFVNIFRQKQLPEFLRITFFGVIFLMFLLHTIGLVLRWYISGHAPWSNGYESVVYVAWAVMLAGFVFGRKYPMVVGTAAFLSGIALFVAHLSWMNPEITPLVPVLKSYWLAIHVAIITASYGFIGLSTFLGVIVMILMVLRNKSNEQKVTGFIEQITTINEMSATVGLYFLTIGTFLGGVWANESWGRYWGWDPKETWALITVVIYSFIVHMRLIPPLKGIFNYNMASILGFASVMMTYFGVNYYLSGLHSYGKGSADGINPAVPVSFAILGALMVWAYLKNARFEKEKAD